MKKLFVNGLLLTLCTIVIFCGGYTVIVLGIARFPKGSGNGWTVNYPDGKSGYGYSRIAQQFTADKYFWSRPSAVNYDAAGSGGSNKGPSNPEYLKDVRTRIDSFLVHNPGIRKSRVPAELVTGSGSGLDPDISPEAAMVQIPRIAKARNIPAEKIRRLIIGNTEKPVMGLFGPSKINVLALNIALDELK
jgi:potassium-transporting ATPase KdpC subunit